MFATTIRVSFYESLYMLVCLCVCVCKACFVCLCVYVSRSMHVMKALWIANGVNTDVYVCVLFNIEKKETTLE